MSKGFIFFILIFAFQLGYGQTQKDAPCATMEMDSLSRAKFPQRGRLEDFEEALQEKIKALKAAKKNGRIMGTVVNIPIIVHVVHNGEAIGTGTNISLAQIKAQIEVLNEDFRKILGTPGGASTNPLAADIEIEFCLSPIGQGGEALDEPGVHRYNGGRGDWSRDQIENQLKPATIWNANLFFNMWSLKFASSDANLIGYAQFPDQSGLSGLNVSGGPASTDGVVVRYQSFGSTDKGNFPVMVAPYNKGRTLAHETGHWLGLRHIWGDGACADDFVSDTPAASGPSSGCPVGRVSCGGINMVENYMDYSNDVCMNLFTEGQKIRMQAVIQNSPRRKSLIEANLCSPPVADIPKTNFDVANPSCILLGSKVDFTDLSTNFPSEWHWEFEGGDPSTSSDRNPKIQYNNQGTFYVSLWSKNGIGISDTLKVEGLITVTAEGICRDFNNFKTGFTPSKLKLASFGNHKGYLAGTNSLKSAGLSEFFKNECGYVYVSGLNIRFGKSYTLKDDAKVNFVVWNARGPQNAPGSVIEKKVVLYKQIKEDISKNRPTSIVFDRETPVFGKPFQVGIELEYTGDSLAIISSKNGEATNSTSWIKDKNGTWSPMSIAFGANVAMDIEPVVGMNPSVQVAASTQLAYPGQQVILNGRGASIFVWNSDDGVVSNFTGPQLIVNPKATTTYFTKGSGLELCTEEAGTTVYVSDNVTRAEQIPSGNGLTVYPNPGAQSLTFTLNNNYFGPIAISLIDVLGRNIIEETFTKDHAQFSAPIESESIQPGLYLVRLSYGNKTITQRWISN